jgi:PAS domain S-box-containing protein
MRKIFLLVLLCLGVGALFLIDSRQVGRLRAEKELELKATINLLQVRLKSAIASRFSALEALASIFVLHPETTPEDFAQIADSLMQWNPPMRALQFADSSTRVIYVYPPKGNEITIKQPMRLLTDPNRGPFVQKAIDQKKAVMQGPFELRQGGIGVVVRLPIFKENVFLGLAIGVYDIPVLMAEALEGLQLDQIGFHVKDDRGHVFWGADKLSDGYQILAFPVADTTWTMAANWRTTPTPPVAPRLLMWLCGLGFLVSGLLAVHLAWAQSQRLETIVDERTRDLLSTNEALKLSEASLKHERDLIERIMETSPGGIVQADADGCIVYANSRAEQILGIQIEQETARAFNDPVWKITDFDGQSLPEEKLPFYLVKNTGRPVTGIHYAIEWPDGKRVLLSINAAPLVDSLGAFEGIVATIEDITQRHQAEQNYQMLFKEMINGFALHEIICDDHGNPIDYRFLTVNPAFERLTGLKVATLLGRTALEVMPDTEPFWIQRYAQVALTGKPASFENYAQALGRYLQVSAFRPARNQLACIFVDVTERKQIENRLQQAQKMESIGTLAGGIAHDFNNILFPIIGMSEILMEDLAPDSLEYANAQEILKAGLRGRDLVKQILAFSRQTEQTMMPIGVQQVLKEAIKLIRASIPSNIEITQDLAQDCGMVLADSTQLHQIAMNLMTNAYHALEQDGGEISIKLTETELTRGNVVDSVLRPGRYALLSISDTGCGIDPAYMDKIFEPYFTTKEQNKGTGLGLAMVYGIVKEHNGDIKVYSEVGQGTTFQVYLPLMKKSADGESDTSNDISLNGNERILAVDDEKALVNLEKQMLERLGYRVVAHTGSLDALAAFKADPDQFDLVISDMTMPNMTGDRLAQELLAIQPTIPVIICTGFSERIDPQKAEAMGIKGFLRKPIVKSDLARMVRRVLDEGREDATG